MRAFAATLLVLLGCSSAGTDEDDPPPVLEVLTPARGTFADTETITVSGRVTDNGPVQVTVAGMQVTPAADGTFTATIAVGTGIELIETHAIDNAGNDVRDVRAVLAGELGPSDGTEAGEIGARAGVTALRGIGNAIANSANAVNFDALAKSMNPIYNNTGCLGAVLNVTSVQHGEIGVVLAPKTGALSTDVTIDDVTVKMSASFKVACLGGSTTITLRATKAKIHGDLGLRVSSAKLLTSLPSASVTFDGFSLDIGGIPSQLESLVRTQAQNGVSSILNGIIRSQVPPFADKAVAGLVAKPVNASLLNKDLTITVAPSNVAVSATELFVGLSAKVLVAGGEGGMFLTTPMALSTSTMSGGQGLGAALDDDIVNQLFAGLWAADAIDQSIDISTVPALGVFLDNNAKTLSFTPSLPPTVSTDTGELELAIGDLIIIAKDETGAEVHRVALQATTTLSAEPSQSGKILLAVGSPSLKAQVLANGDMVEDPLTDEQVEGLVSGVWGLIGTLAEDALGKLPMPTIAGVQLGAPTVEAGDGFVIAEVSVQ